MKKILHISKYYYPFRGGTEQIAQDCVKALKGKYEQKVLCFNDGREDREDILDRVNIIRAGCFAKIASQSLSFSYGRLLKEIITSFQPDIIVFHYPNPFAAFYLLRYIPRCCKLIIYWHLDIVKQKLLRQFFVLQNKKLIKRADIIIATSQKYLEGSSWLRSVREKCRIVPNCINAERLKQTPEVINMAEKIKDANKNKIICLAVGRHVKYKGLKYLIRAAHLLDDSFVFFIAGRGEETARLKAEAGDDKKIKFLGLVDDEELMSYFSAMDIFCFPSITKNEAFGLTLAEAMFCGKPAVTFTIPGSGVNYVCLNGENGIEVPNKDVEKYAEALRRLGADEELRKNLGVSGKKRVEENFMDAQYRNNIQQVVSNVDICSKWRR